MGAHSNYSEFGDKLWPFVEKGSHDASTLAKASKFKAASSITRRLQGTYTSKWDKILPQVILGNQNEDHEPVFEYRDQLNEILPLLLRRVNRKKQEEIEKAVKKAFDDLNTPEHAPSTIQPAAVTSDPRDQASLQLLNNRVNSLEKRIQQLEARVKRLEQE